MMHDPSTAAQAIIQHNYIKLRKQSNREQYRSSSGVIFALMQRYSTAVFQRHSSIFYFDTQSGGKSRSFVTSISSFYAMMGLKS